MMNASFNNLRLTSLGGRAAMGALASLPQEQVSELVGGQMGVDEMVWNGNSGTIATFQDAPSLARLLNSNHNGSACSFII